jgi:DNA-binding LacI/PurR family transcriptional regulator
VSRRHRGPTLESVAAAAGVSRQTVSNVLNAPERVAPATRERVEAAIRALNYRPNRLARSLRTRASRLLGYCYQPVIDGALNPVLDRFLHAVTDAAAAHGFHILLFTAPPGAAGLDRYAELLGQQAVDGFILSDTEVGDPRHAWLSERNVPFVSFGRTWTGEERGPWVDVDGAAGTAQAVRHLYDLGHRRIAFLGWPEGSGAGDDRLAGYRSACESLGVPPLVVRAEQGTEPGRAGADRLLGSPDPPTAVVCVSDLCAYGVLRALAERGLRPGHDVAVVGFDDTPAAALPGIELTSVAQPVEQVGHAVVRLLLAQLGVLDPPDLTDHLLLRPTLTVRASTVPAGGSQPPEPPEPRRRDDAKDNDLVGGAAGHRPGRRRLWR